MNRTSTQPLKTEMATNIPFYLHGHALFSSNGSINDEPNTTPLYYDDYYSENLDPSEFFPCDYGSHASSILPVLYSMFFVVGMLGNSLVVWVILMSVKCRSLTDICLLNLALANLLLVSSLPFLAHYARDQWIFGGAMCTMVLSFYHIGFYSGIFFIVLMSVDRYLAVVHPVFYLRVRTRTCGILASAFIWVIAIAASFPELIHLNISKYKNQTLCKSYPTSDGGHHLFLRTFGIIKMNVLGLIIPLIVIGLCYSMILKKLLRAHSSRKQAMRLVIIVMVVFFCCWTPYNVAAFVKALEVNKLIDSSCESSKTITLSLQITEAVSYLHSCLNPILYVSAGEKFRRRLFRSVYSQTKDNCSSIIHLYAFVVGFRPHQYGSGVDVRSSAQCGV
ncbi:C-C chemokine receptor type 5-like [Triplophysa dalaica]|uniref:C-C chemokine receptor type 5-like n=1 Tax=Triplophysa dalaica TaxID=1582913 RepID=UPI0024DF4803|nr:C-C chemokine receptor type 5-like [Triplophysa dalaica]